MTKIRSRNKAKAGPKTYAQKVTRFQELAAGLIELIDDEGENTLRFCSKGVQVYVSVSRIKGYKEEGASMKYEQIPIDLKPSDETSHLSDLAHVLNLMRALKVGTTDDWEFVAKRLIHEGKRIARLRAVEGEQA